MSLTRDEFQTRIVGNVVLQPQLIQEGKTLAARARIATNPRAKKYDPRTGSRVPDEKRKRRRSFVELHVGKPAMAEKFYQLIHLDDRIWVEGECETISIPKLIYSPQRGELTPVQVDVDNNGNYQTVMEDRVLLHITRFGKIEVRDGYPIMVGSA